MSTRRQPFTAAERLIIVALAAASLFVLFQISRAEAGEVIGRRPPDCPHAWCGCGLRKYLGIADRRLNEADKWGEIYPRIAARPGAVAVRTFHRDGHGHVMLLVRQTAPTRWMVRDFNGTRGLAWLYERDVRGFKFVSTATRLGALQ